MGTSITLPENHHERIDKHKFKSKNRQYTTYLSSNNLHPNLSYNHLE